MTLMCKLTVDKNNKITADSVEVSGNIINEDKKYKFLIPTDGVLTYSITNSDGEITDKQVKKAVRPHITNSQFQISIICC